MKREFNGDVQIVRQTNTDCGKQSVIEQTLYVVYAISCFTFNKSIEL